MIPVPLAQHRSASSHHHSPSRVVSGHRLLVVPKKALRHLPFLAAAGRSGDRRSQQQEIASVCALLRYAQARGREERVSHENLFGD